MLWAHGITAVLIAYVDASKRDGGTLSVAIVAFGADRAKKATRRWIDLWGQTRCHMTDLNSRKRQFQDWSADKAHIHMVESVKIMNTAQYGIAVSCNVADVERLAPKSAGEDSMVFHGGLTRAYALCCHVAMYAVALHVRTVRPGAADIAYFFEKGDEHQTESQAFIANAVATRPGAFIYGCRSHALLQKSDARIFEMVDFLAWEWAKHVERVGNGTSKMRPSLGAFLNIDPSNTDPLRFASGSRYVLHMRDAKLIRFYERCEELGIFSDSPTPDQLKALHETASQSSLASLL